MIDFLGSQNFIAIIYLVASALFILALKWMNSPATARRGIFAGETGMVLARPKLSLQPASAGHSHQSEGLCVLAHDPDNAHDGGRAGGELRSNPLDQLLPWNVGAKVFDEQRQRRSR